VKPEPIRLETPLSIDDVESLKSGDVVRLYGVLYAARDAAHARMQEAVHKGEPLPFDPEGQVVYYTGPAPARPGAGGPDDRVEDGPVRALADQPGLEGHDWQGCSIEGGA
jgi:fumarate hydratase subunit beta